MSKAYARQKAEEKKKNSSASSQSAFQKEKQAYEQQKVLDIQAAKRASENFTRASTNTKYNQNLQAYMDRLNALKSYGYDVSKPTAQIRQEMKRIQPAVQQENPNPYTGWTPEQLRKGIAATSAQIEDERKRKRNNLILKDRLSKMQDAAYQVQLGALSSKEQQMLISYGRQMRSVGSRQSAAQGAQLMGQNPFLAVQAAQDTQQSRADAAAVTRMLRSKGYSADEIKSFLDWSVRKEEERAQRSMENDVRNAGTAGKIAASIGSVPLNIAGGVVGYADAALQRATASKDPFTGQKRTVDYYSPGQTMANTATGIRSAVSEDMGTVGSFLYNTGMSIADFVAAGAAPGEHAASILLGGSAAQNAMQEAHRRGASDNQALAFGLASGIAEATFEKLSIGNIKKIKRLAESGALGGWHLLAAIGVQAGTEASEEGLTTLANTISDALIMRDKSELNTAIRMYMAQGMSEDEATKQAWKDWGSGLLQDVLGGALSGGFIGSVGGGIASATGASAQARQQVQLQQRLQRADAFNAAQRNLFAGNTMQTGTADAEAARVLARNSGTQGARDVATVRRAAQEQYGAQEKAVESVFEAGTADAETFQRQFQTAYDLGKSGAAVETAMNTPATADLNELQRENAWAIGREAGIREGTIKEEANANGETIRVRGSGERDAGQSAAGQVQQVEGNTGSYQEGRSLGVGRNAKDSAAADLRYSEEVKSLREFGVKNGAVIKNLRAVDTSSLPEGLNRAKQDFEAKGYQFVPVAGLLHAQDAPGGMITRARGMVDEESKTVFVQVDNERFTGEQISAHEDGHLRIARGEIDLAATKEAVRESMGEERFERAMNDYAEAYAGLDMTEDEIWEEIVCDAQGEMNIFEGTLMQNAEQRASDLIRETKAQTTAGEQTQERAPPEKTKFSMETPVEETDRLIAWHNMGVDALNGALELGGLAMPSWAIQPANKAHTQYGDVSVIAPRDLVDPKRNRNSMIFGGDAWTPVFPEVNYKVSYEAAEALEDEIKALVGEDVYRQIGGAALDKDNIADQFKRSNGRLSGHYARNLLLQYAYLKSTGSGIEAPTKEDNLYYGGDFTNEDVRRFAGRLTNGKRTLEKLENMSVDELFEQDDLLQAIADVRYESYREKMGAKDRILAVMEKEGFFSKEKVNYTTIDRMLKAARKYLDGGVQQTVDKKALQEIIDREVDQSAYEAWILQKLNGTVERKGIRNEKDLFTPSGNRRSFDQLNYAYTLANIVKAMKAQPKQGRAQFLSGPGSVRGAAMKSYKDIEQVRSESGRVIDPENYSEAPFNEYNNNLSDILDRMTKNGDKFDASDAVIEILQHAKTEQGIYNYMQRELKDWYNVSPELAHDIYELIGQVNALPIPYFEGKTYDAVRLDEALAIVVPDTINADLKQRLEDAGANVREYKAGDEADRLRVVNSVEGAKFSRELDDRYMQAVESGDIEAAQAAVDEAAKKAGYNMRGVHLSGADNITVFQSGNSAGLIYFADTESNAKKGARASKYKYDAYLSVDNPVNSKETPINWYDAEDSVQTARWRRQGHDAVYVRDEAGVSLAVFNPEQIKSADPVTYDDDGNVIPLSERFNPDETDIRYSRETDIDQLARENEKLKREIERWRSELKTTNRGREELRERDVRKAAKSLIERTDSTLSVDDIMPEMQTLGNYLIRGERNERRLSWTEAERQAGIIAAKLVDSAQAMIEESDPALYRRVKSYLNGQKIAVPDNYKNDLDGGYAEFRKAHPALKLSKNGLDVDSVYQEMQELFGKGLFPDEIRDRESGYESSDPAAMLQQIADVVEGLEPIYDNPYSYYREEALAWAENLTIDSLMSGDVRQRKTKADKFYEKARKKNEEWRKRELARLKTQFREKEQRARERREEREGINKYRRRVEQKAKQLGDWLLKNSAKEHIPENLKKPVAEFLATIDFTSKRQLGGGAETQKDKRFAERLRALTSTLEKMQSGGAEDSLDSIRQHEGLPPYYMEFLKMLSEKAVTAMENGDVYTINQMTAAELKTLDETITAIVKTIRMMNRLYENGRAANAQALGFETIEETDKLGTKKASGERGDAVRSFFAWDNTNPFYAFKRLGSAAASVFEEIQNGWDRFAFNVIKIMDFTKEAYTSEEVRKWGNEVHEFELESGEKVYMTTAQIMSLRMLLRREQAVQHIQGGGVRIDDIDAKGKGNKHLQAEHYHLTAKDIEQITGTLTERQREVASALQKFMQQQGGEWGNHVSRARWDIDFFGEENYFPIVTEDSDRNAIDPEARANDLFRLLNMGATKSLNPNANNALVIRDIFDVFADHMTDMAKYDGLALPILDAMKWLNYRFREETSYDEETGKSEYRSHTVQRAIEKAYGKEALRYLTTFMRDLNGVNESTGRGEGFARKMISNYKVAAVAANLRVALLQPTSYFRALYAINGRYLARAIFAKPAVKECEKYSGMAAWKSLGYYDTNIARGVREQIKDSGGAKDKVQSASMKGAEWGDKLTWGALWNACKFAVKNEQPGLDHEALMEATAKKFREVVYSTQVVDSTMTRSHNMRGKSLYGSMATAFMAEPTLSYNIVMDAVSEFQNEARRTNRQEAWKKTHGKVAKAFTVYCLSGLAASIAESIMDAFRDDDEYEKFYQKFLEAMFGEKGIKGRLNGNLANDLLIFNKLPLIKDALSLLSGYSTDRIDMEWMSNAIKAFGAIKEKIELDTGNLEKPTKTTYYGNMTWYGAVYLGLKTLSQATGLPVGSATREVVTLWNNTVGSMTGQKIVTYDSKPEKQIQKGFENGWLTEENAIRLLVDEGAAKDEDDAWFKVQKWSTGEGKFDAAVDSMISGDKKAFNAAVKNLTAHGVKQKSVESSMKSAIRDHYVGTDEEPASIGADRAKKLLQDYVGMKADEAAETITGWKAKLDTGYELGEVKEAYLDGDLSRQQVVSMRMKYAGDSQEDAEAYALRLDCEKEFGIEYGVQNVMDAVVDGSLTDKQAREIWKKYGGKDDEYIDKKLAQAEFVKQYPSANAELVNETSVAKFREFGEPTGIKAADFLQYWDAMSGYSADVDVNGKTINGSKKQKVINYIASLPITSDQKTALYLAEGYALSKLPSW